MELKGKKLLLMGGGAYVKGIKKYADEKGFYMIAVGSSANTPLRHIADEFYQIDTQDVDAVTALVKEKGIDGIFVGSSEVNIDPAITVSERTGCHFYANREQWDIISDKAQFKELARQFGVPVPRDFYVTEEFHPEDLAAVEYPVIVKPVDSSGARGMNVCYNEEELKKYYLEALEWSKSKKIVVEELITGGREVFFHYTIQDGVYSLSMGFTKFKVESAERDFVSLPIFHMYPSSHIDSYIEKVDAAAKSMFQSIGLQNGIVMLQGFDIDGEFKFFESGFRMGGEQMYVFTDHQNNINSLELMINYALTGKMADFNVCDRDNARFKWPCCNYYIPLKAGIITEVRGLEQVEAMENVLNVTKMYELGDEILDTNALERVCMRLHVYGKTAEELAEALVKISATLEILDQNGNEMQIEHLQYDRCLNAIQDGCLLNNDDCNAPYAGKRLLILGGTVASYDLVKMAKDMGIYTIVADDRENGAAKEIADEKVQISTTDIDALTTFVQNNRIDGIFCSPSEFNIQNAIRLCERTGMYFYTDAEHWNRCNNKNRFKQYCKKNGLPFIADYQEQPSRHIGCADCSFPLIIKPADSCGSQGVTVCHEAAAFNQAIDKALVYSKSGEIVIEKYLDNGGRLFSFRYLLNDGDAYPYLLMDTYIADPVDKKYLVSAFSLAPSEHAEAFLEKADQKVRATFKDMGLKNGTVFAQAIPYDGNFYCHDMGYRLSGGITYRLSETLCGINDMKMMLRHTLGGPICTAEEAERINPLPKDKLVGQLMIPLMAGTIGEIDGMDVVQKDPAVLSCLQYYYVGDTLSQRDMGTLAQQFARIYIQASTKDAMVAAINRIQDAISIKDTDGNEMFTLRFDTNRLYR